MSQSGFTPIKLYASSTASAVPLAANLDNTNGAELAVNTADEKLYLKNSAGVVKVLASSAGAIGTVSSVAATVPSFLSVTGSPITTAGTLAIAYSGTALPVANGGTGVTTSTGTGNTVLSTSPTLVTPTLGTPASVTLTNATGLPISTGVSGLGAGVATFLATPSSANLASAVTDETGTGALVFANSPTLVTPTLGTPASVTLTNATGLPLSTGTTGILAVASGGSGTATPSLVAGSNVTISGTWPNQTVAATGGGGASAATPTALGTVYGRTSACAFASASLGYAAGGSSSNFSVYVGRCAGTAATGQANTVVGFQAGLALTVACSNTLVGNRAYFNATGGTGNSAFGNNAMLYRSAGTSNVAIGSAALQGCSGAIGSNTGGQNVAVGSRALACVTTGQKNSAFGNSSGELMTTGSCNVIIGSYSGNQSGLDIRTLSNYLVLSSGAGTPRIYHNGTTVVIPNLPSSATGLPVGGLWKCGTTLKVVV